VSLAPYFFLTHPFNNGKELFVGFRPWAGEKTSIIKVSLKGFAKGLDGLK
jgi:invasion protein IalB